MGHSSYQPPGSVVMGVGNIQLERGFQTLFARPTYTHTVQAFHRPTVGVLRLPDDPVFPLQSAHTPSRAEKKGVLKGTPSTLSPRGKGAAVSSEMELPEEVGETTALAPSHLGIRQCEAQGGASRAHTEGPAMSSRKPGCAELKGWGVGSQRAVISPCVSKRPERRATGPSRTGADGIPSCARQPECNVSRSWDIHQTNRKGHG
ncbi:unnamed protein product [Rangifer tarandus platyrhynchus]|uniref:Uncharacterized protein n=1 Tax=Rangifer tarandus platyrhynchus TaxID=3082113 RepID=A0AC59YF72_RANTA